MAESTLSLTFIKMVANIGSRLYGTLSPTGADLTECKRIVNEGYTYYASWHDWSSLHPAASIILWPSASETMSVGGPGNTTVTSTGTPFSPAMIGDSRLLATTGANYTVATYTTSAKVTVTADASTDDGNAFTITADGNYLLPDDFGEPESLLSYGENTGYGPLRWTGPDEIRARRAGSSSGYQPTLASLQSRELVAATGQRWELMVWPTPSALTTLFYQYLRNPAAMSADGDYPVGGMRYSPAVMQCAYAVLEADQGRTEGPEAAKAERLLATARKTDLRQQSRILGLNVDNSDNTQRRRDHMNWQDGLDIS